VPADSHHDEDSSEPTRHDSDTTFACEVLKSVLVTGQTAVLVQPEFDLLYTLAPFTAALTATATEPAAPISRDAWPRDWVFTPEVSLGPALHSLAPPFLS
jgi:hypothetical protein